jgi:hypothetical protein
MLLLLAPEPLECASDGEARIFRRRCFCDRAHGRVHQVHKRRHVRMRAYHLRADVEHLCANGLDSRRAGAGNGIVEDLRCAFRQC